MAQAHHKKAPSTMTKALIPKSQNVKVFIRFRPENRIEREKLKNDKKLQKTAESKRIKFAGNDTIRVPDTNDSVKAYTFDGVLQATTTQRQAFEAIATQTCNDILEGYNGTIFVYGQTGSGKTHTMV